MTELKPIVYAGPIIGAVGGVLFSNTVPNIDDTIRVADYGVSDEAIMLSNYAINLQQDAASNQLSFTASVANKFETTVETAPVERLLLGALGVQFLYPSYVGNPDTHRIRYQLLVSGDSGFETTESLDNQTTRRGPIDNVVDRLRVLFQQGTDDIFEDGVENEFSKQLLSLIRENCTETALTIASMIDNQAANLEALSEALRWIGHVDDSRSFRIRRWLLERALFSNSAKVRDGAVLGISYLNDSHAVTYLRDAIAKETISDLRKDMQQALRELESKN